MASPVKLYSDGVEYVFARSPEQAEAVSREYSGERDEGSPGFSLVPEDRLVRVNMTDDPSVPDARDCCVPGTERAGPHLPSCLVAYPQRTAAAWCQLADGPGVLASTEY